MRSVNSFSIFLTCCFLVGCSSLKNPLARIQDPTARQVIERSIEAYGGLENWNAIDYLSFDKWFALYDAQGVSEIDRHETHHYTEQKIYMTWQEDDVKIEQSSYQNTYAKVRDGVPDPSAKQQSIANSILAATFVMNFPYNLLDKGSTISYEGETVFMDKPVHVIKVEYFPETQNHHTTKDIWWHYIEKESHLSLGYKVKHLDHISLVKNLSFHEINGFTFPHKRESFRVDENGEELFLRAEYEYSNYSVLKN